MKTKDVCDLQIIDRTQETNKNLVGKSISILGDSISSFSENYNKDERGNKWSDGLYTYKGNRVRYPQDNLLNDVNETWWMRLINRNNMELLVNETWAGSRIAWDGVTDNGTHQGPDIYVGSPTRVKRLDKEGRKPDIIMVFAGINDINHSSPLEDVGDDFKIDYKEDEIDSLDVTTFPNAYNAMLVRLKKYYPTSTIICLLPYYATGKSSAEKTDEYDNVMKKICELHGVTYVDLRKCKIPKYEQTEYIPDNLHPNEKGMKLIFEHVNKMN